MGKQISIVPIVCEVKCANPKRNFVVNCTGAIINNKGDILTCSHFINKFTRQYQNDRKLYEEYLEKKQRILNQSYGNFLKTKNIKKLTEDPSWNIGLEIYLVGKEKSIKLDRGNFYFDEGIDVLIIKDTGAQPIEPIDDNFIYDKELLDNEGAYVFGYVSNGGNPLDYKNYEMKLYQGKVLGKKNEQLTEHSINAEFYIFSKGLHKGLSGAPYLSSKGLVGIQSMTYFENGKVTDNSTSLFTGSVKIRYLINKHKRDFDEGFEVKKN